MTPSDDAQRYLHTVNEILDMEPESPEFVVKPLIAEDSVMMLYGESGRGKTSALYQLAYAIAEDEDDWLGFEVESSGPVIFLELDMMGQETRIFLDRVRDEEMTSDNIYLPTGDWSGFDVLDGEAVENLAEVCEEIEPTAVIVDTVEDAYQATGGTSPQIVQNVMKNLQSATGSAALVFSRHTRKSTKRWSESEGDSDVLSRGSFASFGQWEQAPTATSVQIGYQESEHEAGYLLKFHKTRLGHPGFKVLGLQVTDNHFFYIERDHRQLLANWPGDIPKPDAQLYREAESVSDVCHSVAKVARENPETVRRHYYRAKERGTSFAWEDEILDPPYEVDNST